MQIHNVKGTGVISTRTYVESKHNDRYKSWLKSLPKKSNDIYTKAINSTNWYNIEDAYLSPMEQIAKSFFDGDEKTAALDVGKYSAEYALKGVYKVFLMRASPQTLMKASKRIASIYYNNVKVSIDNVKKKSLIINCTRITTKNKIFDYRTIGWCIKALELTHCKNVIFEDVDTENSEMFAFKLSWD
ncbi:MAG: hypothetical protein B6I18_09500 [Bacteroidetes bacterium 4572_112]|nr:MAG: hypothetical protein B6I18_09500 [Bacteroidetes bacterium 4572_112]